MRYLIFLLSLLWSVSPCAQTPYPLLDSLSIEQVMRGKREVRWNTDYHRDSSNAFQPMRAVRMQDLLRKAGLWYVTVGDTIVPVNSLDTLFVQGLGGIVTGLLPGGTNDTLTIGIDSVQGLPWYLTDGTDIEPIGTDTVLFKGYGCVTVDVVPGSPDTVKITCLMPDGSETIVTAGTGISVTGVGTIGNPYIVTNTGDLSSSNELQLLTATGAGPTSYNINLNLGGGDVTLQEGTGIDLTRSGNTITIASTIVDTDDQNLTLEGTGPNYTIDIENGTDVIVAPGSGISLSESPANTLVITNTGDLSNTNELQTLSNTSDATTHTTTLSNSGGSIQFVEGSGITLTTTGTALNGILTIAAVDASTTNEIQALTAGGAGPTAYTLDLSLGGGSVTLTEGANIDLTRSGNNITIAVVPDGDGSSTNELQLLTATGAGPTSYNINLNLGGGDVTLTEGTGIDLTRSGNTITIASTIVDTDTDDQFLTLTGTGPTYTIDIDNGSDIIVSPGSGISLSESPANTLVITNTGDLSNTNELQTLSNTSDATSHTVTLSNSGGSTKLVEGSLITLTTTGTVLDGIITIASTADPSSSNEIQTLSASGAGPTSYNLDLSLGGGTVTLTEGTGINLTRTGNDITIAWTGTTLNGIYGDGTPGSGSSFLPPGGSVVDVDDDDPLTFDLTNGSGQYNRMMRFEISYTSDDAVTDAIAIVTPSDSFKIVSFDQGIQVQYAGPGGAGRGLEIISNTQLHLDADSIRSQPSSILDKTQLHYLAGYYASPELTYSKIAGTSNGQIMKWNSAGYWELGTDNAGGSGTVTGTGTATRLAWWDGTTSISSDAAAYWDNTNKRLGIGAGTTPSATIDATTNSLGTTQTITSGLAVVNTTAAAAGAQQISPAIRWSGRGWKTNATAASQTVEFRAYVTPVQGTANPTGYLGFGSAINGTWTNDRFNFSNNGEMGIGTTNFAGAGTFAKLNVYGGAATDFSPFIFNGFAASQSGGTVWASIANTLTTASAGLSLNESGDINTIRAGVQRFGSTHATRPNELNIFNTQSSSITLTTNNILRYTMSNVGTSFQPGKLGAGQSTEAAVTSTIQTNSLGTAYLETAGAPTFDDTKHTVIYTASTNISWTLPTAASCACAGREYVLHHAGTAGVITLSQSITKGNAGNFNTLNAGEWAHIYYGSSSIRGYKLTSL